MSALTIQSSIEYASFCRMQTVSLNAVFCLIHAEMFKPWTLNALQSYPRWQLKPLQELKWHRCSEDIGHGQDKMFKIKKNGWNNSDDVVGSTHIGYIDFRSSRQMACTDMGIQGRLCVSECCKCHERNIFYFLKYISFLQIALLCIYTIQ
jgi:hypothetical protein